MIFQSFVAAPRGLTDRIWQDLIQTPRRKERPEIQVPGSAHVTLITTAEVEDVKHQDRLLQLMAERARFVATQPGFISISLHRSLDGKRIVNYVQWASREQLVAAHHRPELRAR